MFFHEWVREERVRRDITQAGLANITDLSEMTILRVERGDFISLYTAQRICGRFGHQIVAIPTISAPDDVITFIE
jgi:DNA-binding XRE family transcriptional regulator